MTIGTLTELSCYQKNSRNIAVGTEGYEQDSGNVAVGRLGNHQ